MCSRPRSIVRAETRGRGAAAGSSESAPVPAPSRAAIAGRCRLERRVGGDLAALRGAGDPPHDEKRLADHLGIGAGPERLRHRDAGGEGRLQHREFLDAGRGSTRRRSPRRCAAPDAAARRSVRRRIRPRSPNSPGSRRRRSSSGALTSTVLAPLASARKRASSVPDQIAATPWPPSTAMTAPVT